MSSIPTEISSYIGDITVKKIDDYENIYSVNPLYLMIGDVIGHIKENNRNKYLVFDSAELLSTDKNKEVLKKYTELWYEMKNKIEIINGGKTTKCDIEFMKITFDSDDELPLNK